MSTGHFHCLSEWIVQPIFFYKFIEFLFKAYNAHDVFPNQRRVLYWSSRGLGVHQNTRQWWRSKAHISHTYTYSHTFLNCIFIEGDFFSAPHTRVMYGVRQCQSKGFIFSSGRISAFRSGCSTVQDRLVLTIKHQVRRGRNCYLGDSINK